MSSTTLTCVRMMPRLRELPTWVAVGGLGNPIDSAQVPRCRVLCLEGHIGVAAPDAEGAGIQNEPETALGLAAPQAV